MSVVEFDPDNWLTTLHRALASYTKLKINQFILDNTSAPSGLEAYDVVMDWPDADDPAKTIALEKTVIHFVADDIANTKLGFGNDIVNAVEVLNPAPTPDYVQWQSGRVHEVNYDVGVWASDKSGGSTSRLAAYEMLDKIFGSDQARRDFRTATQGVEIRRFTGGSFITDRINDVRVFRVIDCELVLRVFSRIVLEDQVIAEEIVQDPDLEIDNTPIS